MARHTRCCCGDTCELTLGPLSGTVSQNANNSYRLAPGQKIRIDNPTPTDNWALGLAASSFFAPMQMRVYLLDSSSLSSVMTVDAEVAASGTLIDQDLYDQQYDSAITEAPVTITVNSDIDTVSAEVAQETGLTRGSYGVGFELHHSGKALTVDTLNLMTYPPHTDITAENNRAGQSHVIEIENTGSSNLDVWISEFGPGFPINNGYTKTRPGHCGAAVVNPDCAAGQYACSGFTSGKRLHYTYSLSNPAYWIDLTKPVEYYQSSCLTQYKDPHGTASAVRFQYELSNPGVALSNFYRYRVRGDGADSEVTKANSDMLIAPVIARITAQIQSGNLVIKALTYWPATSIGLTTLLPTTQNYCIAPGTGPIDESGNGLEHEFEWTIALGSCQLDSAALGVRTVRLSDADNFTEFDDLLAEDGVPPVDAPGGNSTYTTWVATTVGTPGDCSFGQGTSATVTRDRLILDGTQELTLTFS